jgi:DNA segregation ATPase FtsK/SpoIIIE-like protein
MKCAIDAGEENEAQAAIRTVHREVRRRKDTEDTDAPRIVLVIDELAEVGDRDTLDLLSSILRVGRSFRVNVVAATQLPTKATCGEKNNYTVRFVGAVTDAKPALPLPVITYIVHYCQIYTIKLWHPSAI